MNRVATVFLFVVFTVSSALAAQKPQTPGTAGSDVNINSFTLTASDGMNQDSFGESVAISGNTVVVGALEVADARGSAYVFVKPPSGWANMTQVAELTASDGKEGDIFGVSVAISGDTIVVGAGNATVNGNRGQGAAYVFVKPPSGWSNMTETAKLTSSDGLPDGSFGDATALDGNTVVIGSSFFQNAQGTAYIFVKPQSGWSDMTQTAELTASDAGPDNDFGAAVSISGTTVVVGAHQDNASNDAGPGAAYVFVEPPSGWTNMTQTAKLRASDGVDGDQFGGAVSISGNTVAVGARQHDVARGRAYVFVEPAGGWVNMRQTAELKDGMIGACFGNSISIYGNELLVGAECFQNFRGAAFLFLKPPTGWRNSNTYQAAVGIHFTFTHDNLATSLALQGKTAIIGAPYAPTFPPCCQPGPGQAFIFTTQ